MMIILILFEKCANYLSETESCFSELVPTFFLLHIQSPQVNLFKSNNLHQVSFLALRISMKIDHEKKE